MRRHALVHVLVLLWHTHTHTHTRTHKNTVWDFLQCLNSISLRLPCKANHGAEQGSRCV